MPRMPRPPLLNFRNKKFSHAIRSGSLCGDPLFFVSPRGLLVQSGRFLGLRGGLAQWGGTAGANHRIVGVIFRTVGATSFGVGAKALIRF